MLVLIESFTLSVKAPLMAYFATTYRYLIEYLIEPLQKIKALKLCEETTLSSSPSAFLHFFSIHLNLLTNMDIAHSEETLSSCLSPFWPLQICLAPFCIRPLFLGVLFQLCWAYLKCLMLFI